LHLCEPDAVTRQDDVEEPLLEQRPRRTASQRSSDNMAKPRSVRLTEIAEILGKTHQRTSVIVHQPGFPKPVGREGHSRLWDRREITAWARKWRREKPWR
jgi:hypothetical protein